MNIPTKKESRCWIVGILALAISLLATFFLGSHIDISNATSFSSLLRSYFLLSIISTSAVFAYAALQAILKRRFSSALAWTSIAAIFLPLIIIVFSKIQFLNTSLPYFVLIFIIISLSNIPALKRLI